MKLKLKLLKGYIIYWLYNLTMLGISFVFNRFFQMLMFILFFEIMQNCFASRFHADTIEKDPIKAVRYCKLITITVEIVYLIFCKNLDITIYSNLFIVLLVALINCIIEINVENYLVKHCTLRNKEYLLELCKQSNLSQIQINRLVMRYIERKTIKEIADIECVTEICIKKSLASSKKLLFND